jgi:hypothetical protein
MKCSGEGSVSSAISSAIPPALAANAGRRQENEERRNAQLAELE